MAKLTPAMSDVHKTKSHVSSQAIWAGKEGPVFTFPCEQFGIHLQGHAAAPGDGRPGFIRRAEGCMTTHASAVCTTEGDVPMVQIRPDADPESYLARDGVWFLGVWPPCLRLGRLRKAPGITGLKRPSVRSVLGGPP